MTNMLYTSEKAAYDRDGFVLIKGLLTSAEFTELTVNLDRYIRDVAPTLAKEHVFYEDRNRPETLKQMHNMGHDPYFAQYRHNPRWQALADVLVGERTVAKEPEWFNKPPRILHPTPPHQDNYYFCLVPPQVVTLWMALDDIDEENGCLRYVTGSHRLGVRPHGRTATVGFSQGVTDFDDRDVAREVAFRLSPGDVLAHHGNTIHRADPNRSLSRDRRAFAMVFQGVSCQRDEAAFERYRESLRAQRDEMTVA